jgi:hypothetical protein
MLIFENLVVVKILMMVFWTVTQCKLTGRYNISKVYTVSIFSPSNPEDQNKE